jgi:hypothetical protein
VNTSVEVLELEDDGPEPPDRSCVAHGDAVQVVGVEADGSASVRQAALVDEVVANLSDVPSGIERGRAVLRDEVGDIDLVDA